MSRSATVAAAWLIWNHNWSVDEAIAHLQSVRPVVNPNVGFRKQLEDWRVEFVEKVVRERQSKALVVDETRVSVGGGSATVESIGLDSGSALDMGGAVLL